MNFFWIDAILAVVLAVFLMNQHRRGRLPPDYLALFALGIAVGSTWEIAFVFLGPEFRPHDPLYIFLSPLPFPTIFQPILHSIWDGGIFLAGVALMESLLPGPVLTRFRGIELGVLLLWGTIQELLVELLATGAGLWTYRVLDWNPALFAFGPGHITLLPHLIWLAAPCVYYPLAVAVRRRYGSSPQLQ
ncbi:MAG: hypothetical protein RIF32_03180 [Leptospirales bacterium]|jgi:hypothetical protein